MDSLENIIEVKEISKSFNNSNFKIENLSFELKKGQITGLVGKNGAGKTTIIKILIGLLAPDSGSIKILNEDLKKLKDVIPSASVDAVTVNPPYMKSGTGIVNDKNAMMVSKHEICCTLEDVIKEASRLLKFNGEFFMVHKSERLVDIFCTMRKYKIEPKRIRFIHPQLNKPSNLVLIEGLRSGNAFLKYEKPLFVYDANNEYTDEIYEIYNMKKGEK